MIVIIDTHIDKSYHSKHIYKAADMIGVHRHTVARWIKGGKKKEQFNHLSIYLESEEL